mmetsp:Transcript_35354/g.79761  ORF Transcript_35354/g.79761 Transcript_35354/m.79761 type:complete len:311 (-) Transcript_35354:229-1161(-)
MPFVSPYPSLAFKTFRLGAVNEQGEFKKLLRFKLLGPLRAPFVWKLPRLRVGGGLFVSRTPRVGDELLEALAKHLSSLLERRGDDPPQVRGRARERLPLVDKVDRAKRAVHLGLRVEHRRRDFEVDPRFGVKLEDHGQDSVVLGARLGHDPLGHLPLHRHHRPAHSRRAVDEAEEDLRRDVIRQVPDHHERPTADLCDGAVVDLEDVRLEDGELRQRVPEQLDGAPVELDSEHLWVPVHEHPAQGARAGAELHDAVAPALGRDGLGLLPRRLVAALAEGVADLQHVVLVAEVVLAERLLRLERELWGLPV